MDKHADAAIVRARELLAAEHERDGWQAKVREIRDPDYEPSPAENRALRAIVAALAPDRSPAGEEVREAVTTAIQRFACTRWDAGAKHDLTTEILALLTAAADRARIECETIASDGDPCTLMECPPGLFRFGDALGFKTEYGSAKWLPDRQSFTIGNWPDAYVIASGETFWGGTSKHEDRAALIVQPLRALTPEGSADV